MSTVFAKSVGIAAVLAFGAVSQAASVTWDGYEANDVGGFYGNTVAVNGSNNLVVGVGPSNGFGFTLNGVAGHVYQGRANLPLTAETEGVQVTFVMPDSNAVGTPVGGANAYDSWISIRTLTYPAGVEHSGDAGIFFTSGTPTLGDMYYANTRVVGDASTIDNPEFSQTRFAPGTTHSLTIARTGTGQLQYSIDGTPFHTSSASSATFAELGTLQLGGGYFVPGSTGDGSDVPTRAFEFTDVTVVPEPTGLAVLALGGVMLLGRRARRK